ncbi:MAG TPA: hypothetical protein PLH07_00200 [Sulfurovum sp.]|jgi:hypothetical protein|nr:MAG: hypothetical protein B7Y63_05510 [Sulfurovum sp. 35-42-20]OYY55291.1 MAG: hypothetical protein B7Y52_05825 [Sulfurovum sp. 28-43-6]OYZ26653.1 MAG: hypothetical protein B7Y23_01315 [Sulfurovum sp. 16-42-52]OYZ48579.1 MAG: hypothetical protein B7Y13_07190 [Sulfurovum sp. 24-42-9]OZA47063.1 MAG: hypothetical protein B7X80_00200 [Sulfurovum sp. 17-42-90]OZA60130.1 MAG: hypothetical protein B7X69_05240 [Sulfurovum sp. 39-42-12]HQS71682.1 hypothetical protein [Sulfurovum sp.]
MSSSLEKLKALASKLEDKLEQKTKAGSPEAEASMAVKIEPESTSVPVEESMPQTLTAVPTSILQRMENSYDGVREENMNRVKQLFYKLKIFEKSPDFENVFVYKAMNLSGIGLKEDDFGEVREGKYIQVIAITYEPDKNGRKKAKNISLGYFGKGETLDETLKSEIIEFVLRWRYEKAFQNLEHYKDLILKVEKPATTLF